jgi:predicted 3-demethylubiquinone-9 3-methyltransferase (glyoxalase superfamily)
MQRTTPCLWFDSQAEEAANFYVSVFPNARVKTIAHYSEGMPMPAGSVLTVSFELDGQDYLALNGGPVFHFTPAVSLMVHCQTQPELDDFWRKLSEGGQTSQCGWLTDRYGLSWQIVPAVLPSLMADPARAQRVMKAIMGMTRLDIAALKGA